MSDSVAITCDTVRGLVEASGRRWAVLIAGDGDATQFVTWGKEAADKVYASDLSEYIAADLCPDQPTTVLESFKLDGAKNKAALEKLRDENRNLWTMLGGSANCVDDLTIRNGILAGLVSEFWEWQSGCRELLPDGLADRVELAGISTKGAAVAADVEASSQESKP